MEEKKDYSLLRPFDLEAAKRGEAICWHSDGEVLQDVTITKRGSVCGLWKESADRGECIWSNEKAAEKFRMAPLAWVEGKPVYKGDGPLYSKITNNHGLADRFVNSALVAVSGGFEFMANPVDFTWTPPMVMRKGFINICKVKVKAGSCGEIKDRIVRNADIFDDENEALKWASQCGDVLATVAVEWPEPAGQEGGA